MHEGSMAPLYERGMELERQPVWKWPKTWRIVLKVHHLPGIRERDNLEKRSFRIYQMVLIYSILYDIRVEWLTGPYTLDWLYEGLKLVSYRV